MLQKSIRAASPRCRRVAARLAARARSRRRPVEVSFYYPGRRRRPDHARSSTDFAADFEKENPGIKIKPIYSGTYQDTITKALTAVKSGEPPVTSILLSTDMYTLIDEDAIVPFDDLIKTPDDQAWLKSFYPGVHGEQPDRRQDVGHSVPALDDRPLLQQGDVQGSGPRSEPGRPRTGRRWPSTRRSSPSATRPASVTQWGVQIPSSGFPYWLFQGLAIENGVEPDERRRHRDLLRQARGDRGAAVLGRPREEVQGASRRHRRVGHDAEGFLREEGRDDVDDDRQPHQRRGPTPSSTSAWRCCPRASSAAARPAAATSTCSRRRRRRSARPRSEFIKWITTPQRAAQWGIDTGYVAVRADAWDTPAMKQYVAGFPAGGGRARPAAVRQGRAVDARQPARDARR